MRRLRGNRPIEHPDVAGAHCRNEIEFIGAAQHVLIERAVGVHFALQHIVANRLLGAGRGFRQLAVVTGDEHLFAPLGLFELVANPLENIRPLGR
jgi:hypothetical protein